MPRKVLDSFSVEWLQVLDEKGAVDRKLMPALSGKEMLFLYERMVFSRALDEKCLVLQRQGRLGTYASVRGQEAAQAGSAFAMEKGDWLFPAFRETAANLVRGVPAENIIRYWAGDERGQSLAKGLNNFMVSIPVATHLPHAVGTAWGMKLRKKRSAVVVYFGDGATSKGDFHESCNWAGVFRLPVVFLCQNNQWAISVPVEKQTAAKTLAQKALAYGFPGIRVDGNDVFAIYRATKEALAKARSGGGPTLIEAFTYRLEHHTTADDSSRYRSQEEVEAWKKKDPLLRLERFLGSRKLLTEGGKGKIWEQARKGVEAAVARAEAAPKSEPGEIFDSVFAQLTPNLEEQKKGLLEFLARGEK